MTQEVLSPRALARRLRLAKVKFEVAAVELQDLMKDAESYIENDDDSLYFDLSYEVDIDNAEAIASELEGLEPEETLEDELNQGNDDA